MLMGAAVTPSEFRRGLSGPCRKLVIGRNARRLGAGPLSFHEMKGSLPCRHSVTKADTRA